MAGGGPAGVSAAIYSARKGLRVAIVAERVGGQVKETVGIENLISVPETTGSELADNLKTHLLRYPVDLLEQRKIEKVELAGKDKLVTTSVGERFIAPALIIATGASWRKLNVPGENDYIGRGVAFCPHCDGPFYKGKHVAVVGGGNVAMDAARSALRCGAKDVRIVYRRRQEDMTALDTEIESAVMEGIELMLLQAPKLSLIHI